MPPKQSFTPGLKTLMTGLVFGESPRWGHDGRLWLADWGAQEIVAVERRAPLHGCALRRAFGEWTFFRRADPAMRTALIRSHAGPGPSRSNRWAYSTSSRSTS